MTVGVISIGCIGVFKLLRGLSWRQALTVIFVWIIATVAITRWISKSFLPLLLLFKRVPLISLRWIFLIWGPFITSVLSGSYSWIWWPMRWTSISMRITIMPLVLSLFVTFICIIIPVGVVIIVSAISSVTVIIAWFSPTLVSVMLPRVVSIMVLSTPVPVTVAFFMVSAPASWPTFLSTSYRVTALAVILHLLEIQITLLFQFSLNLSLVFFRHPLCFTQKVLLLFLFFHLLLLFFEFLHLPNFLQSFFLQIYENRVRNMRSISWWIWILSIYSHVLVIWLDGLQYIMLESIELFVVFSFVMLIFMPNYELVTVGTSIKTRYIFRIMNFRPYFKVGVF